jgi:outer membrane murein-binding lipoprotein Lpp
MISGDYIISAVVAVTTAAGGWSAGKRTSNRDAAQTAAETVDMLQAQVELLKEYKEGGDLQIRDLRSRISVLENLVTQRAEVNAVHLDVKSAKLVIDKIADKVGVE